MSPLQRLAVACCLGFALLGGDARPLRADPILDVIAIDTLLARHDIGNALGLAFNPQANVLYLAHGSDQRGGFIYTLDAQGTLLNEVNLQSLYPGAFPTSLSFDSSSGHLVVVVAVPVGVGFVEHLMEIAPYTAHIFSDLLIDTDGGGGIHVRDDGLWQARFAEDVIRHYTRGGSALNDVSVASSFPGFPGPLALTSSFIGGFFVVDHFGRRIVEVDMVGHEVTAVSTAALGDGRGLAIDADVKTQRLFFQVNNEAIYVLSSEFIGVPIPEPAPLLLFGSGLVVLMGLARKSISTMQAAPPMRPMILREGFRPEESA